MSAQTAAAGKALGSQKDKLIERAQRWPDALVKQVAKTARVVSQRSPSRSTRF